MEADIHKTSESRVALRCRKAAPSPLDCNSAMLRIAAFLYRHKPSVNSCDLTRSCERIKWHAIRVLQGRASLPTDHSLN